MTIFESVALQLIAEVSKKSENFLTALKARSSGNLIRLALWASFLGWLFALALETL